MHHHDWNLGMRQHVPGDAAEEELVDAMMGIGAHYDHRGSLTARGLGETKADVAGM